MLRAPVNCGFVKIILCCPCSLSCKWMTLQMIDRQGIGQWLRKITWKDVTQTTCWIQPSKVWIVWSILWILLSWSWFSSQIEELWLAMYNNHVIMHLMMFNLMKQLLSLKHEVNVECLTFHLICLSLPNHNAWYSLLYFSWFTILLFQYLLIIMMCTASIHYSSILCLLNTHQWMII